jgi:hypothetical protein
MADITVDRPRAKHPPEEREEYDRAYAAATLAGQLAELVYTRAPGAGLTRIELARRTGTTQSSIARTEGGGAVGADRLVQARAGDGRVTRFGGGDMTMPDSRFPDQLRGVGRSCATRGRARCLGRRATGWRTAWQPPARGR